MTDTESGRLNELLFERQSTLLDTSTCRTMALPFHQGDPRPRTVDAAEAAWERARVAGGGRRDVQQRRAHLFALVATHALAPFGSVDGVEEAEPWGRFDFGKCCAEVTVFMHAMGGGRKYHGMLGDAVCPDKAHPQPHQQRCTNGSGPWDFGHPVRWGRGAQSYSGAFMSAFNRTGHRSPLLAFVAHSGLSDEPPRDDGASKSSAAVSSEHACIQLLERTPVQYFVEDAAATDPLRFQLRRHALANVDQWLARVPNFNTGSGFVVDNCFQDSSWGEDFCRTMDPKCTQGATYKHGDAMLHKGSMHCRGFRPFFDIAMPLPARQASAQANELRRGLLEGDGEAFLRRKYLLFFKGDVSPAKPSRAALLKLHDPSRGIILVNRHDSRFDYAESLGAARFGIAPRGAGLFSYRLTEIMQHGGIPVIVADGYVPPFASFLDWTKFSIGVAQAEIPDLEEMLLSIGEQAEVRMARHASFVFEEFLSSNERIAAVALALVERNVKRAMAHFAPQCA